MKITKLGMVKDYLKNYIFPIPGDVLLYYHEIGIFRCGKLGVLCIYQDPQDGHYIGFPIKWNNKNKKPSIEMDYYVRSDGDHVFDWGITRRGWLAYEYTHGDSLYKARCRFIASVFPEYIKKHK